MMPFSKSSSSNNNNNNNGMNKIIMYSKNKNKKRQRLLPKPSSSSSSSSLSSLSSMIGCISILAAILICWNTSHLHKLSFVSQQVAVQMLDGFITTTTSSSTFRITKQYDVCIVGSGGLFGSVLAERYTKELQARVLIIENQRNKGNDHDDHDDANTQQQQQQQHHNNQRISNYISQFMKSNKDDITTSIMKQRMLSSPLITIQYDTDYYQIKNLLRCNHTYFADNKDTTTTTTSTSTGLDYQTIQKGLDLFEHDTGITYIENSINDLTKDTVGRSHQVFHGQFIDNKSLISYANSTKLFVDYTNEPPVDVDVEMTNTLLQRQIHNDMSLPVDTPYGLQHEATNIPGNNAIMGLASYPKNIQTFRLLVGSLRGNGYDGHIILGVHKDIPIDEEEYLKAMDVTYYIVEFVDCDSSIIIDGSDGGGVIRGKCAKSLETLKVEWARFEMCRQWLHACKQCTGWTLVMDTRDIFFQADPFVSLPPANETREDLLFIEEIAPHTNPQPDRPVRADVIGLSRYTGRTVPCYGDMHYQRYFDRPVLCSGTIIGTRSGMHRFLSVLVSEFHRNNAKPNQKCRSPHTTDQWTMNYLYYTGQFGFFNQTKTVPWGTGPVNTIGTPCVDRTKKGPEQHSKDDLTIFDAQGRILNIHEPAHSKARVAPAIHQFDRCHKWIHPWLNKHPELSQKRKMGNGYIPIEELTLPWKK